MDYSNLTIAEFNAAFDEGADHALTFKGYSNVVIGGSVFLFWNNSKNVDYLNRALTFVGMFAGLREQAVVAFLVAFTGAKYDKAKGAFVKGGKMKSLPESINDYEHWSEWAKEKSPERPFDAAKDTSSLLRVIEKRIEKAEAAFDAMPEDADDVDVELLTKHIDRLKAVHDAARLALN